MFGLRALGVSIVAALALAACDSQRKQECEKLLAAMRPLDQGTPTAATADAVRAQVAALQPQDKPLAVYAKNYAGTLTVLSNTLRLKESGSAPDGTEDVVRSNLKKASTDREDVQRYCAQ
jgi:hypothetical protein